MARTIGTGGPDSTRTTEFSLSLAA